MLKKIMEHVEWLKERFPGICFNLSIEYQDKSVLNPLGSFIDVEIRMLYKGRLYSFARKIDPVTIFMEYDPDLLIQDIEDDIDKILHNTQDKRKRGHIVIPNANKR